MKRRQVLGGLLLAISCAPAGRGRREGEGDVDDAPRAGDTAARAGREGEVLVGTARRPTLFFVVPADSERRWQRGRVFGELLNHGGDRELAPLAMYDVVCAPMAELLRESPDLPAAEEPWLVLVDHTRAFVPASAFSDRGLDALAGLEAPGEADIDARIARLAALIRTTVDLRRVARLAALERATLPQGLAEELAITTDDMAPARLEVAAAATATLFSWAYPDGFARDNDGYRAERQGIADASLAALVRDRLVRARPPRGARWARGGGCGIRVEGEAERHVISCGMGHVPKRSQRFLSFLTADLQR